MTIFEIIVLSALFILLATAVVSGIVILYIGYTVHKMNKKYNEGLDIHFISPRYEGVDFDR